MVKQKVKDPEIIFYSRLHINKSGKYEEEIKDAEKKIDDAKKEAESQKKD